MEFQIVGLGDPLHPQVVGAEGADRDRDLLEAFLPLAGGDDDFLEAGGGGLCPQRRGGDGGERGDAEPGNLAAQQAMIK